MTSTGEGKLTKHTVGIDISKDHLDACWLPREEARRFANNRAGFQALVRWIDPQVERIAYEPTGAWHRGFEEALADAGLPLYRINPYQLRCFARSIGRRGKTVSMATENVPLVATENVPRHSGPPTQRPLTPNKCDIFGCQKCAVSVAIDTVGEAEKRADPTCYAGLRPLRPQRLAREGLRPPFEPPDTGCCGESEITLDLEQRSREQRGLDL